MKFFTNPKDFVEYEVDTLINEQGKPFSVVIYESKNNKQEFDLSKDFVEKAASSIFQSEGKQVVFLEMKNGNYKEFPIIVSIDPKDKTKFLAEIDKEAKEPLECSPNLLKSFEEKASWIVSSNPDKVLQYQVANEDQVITRDITY